MIKQVSHPVAGVDAADLALALDVAHELRTPTAPPRVPEVGVPHLMGLRRTGTARPHRRKVPLNRLTTMRG